MLSVGDLPALNATLNAISGVLLVIGFLFIRRGKVQAHRRVMVSALVCSVFFLASYLIYHYKVGSVPFTGTGALRTIYFIVLISHILLAGTVPFLATFTLSQALRGRFPQHKKIARWTLPIWLYVSVTGVIVYWMLYRL